MTDLRFTDDPDTSSFTPSGLAYARMLELARGLDDYATKRVGWDAPAMLYGVAHHEAERLESLVATPVLGDGDQVDLVREQAVLSNLSALFVRVEGYVSLDDFGGREREVRILSGVNRLGVTVTVFRDRTTGRQIVDENSSPLSDLLLSKLTGTAAIAGIFGGR